MDRAPCPRGVASAPSAPKRAIRERRVAGTVKYAPFERPVWQRGGHCEHAIYGHNMKIILVHNSGAGDADHNREWLVRLIEREGHDVSYFAATDDWKAAAGASVDLIVAAGGDGTVADVARHVAGSSIPIGVLPLGTANNVAVALGLAGRPIPDLVVSWMRGERRPFDAGCTTGPEGTFRFLESVGIGLLAESIAEITEGRAQYVDQLSAAEARMDAAIGVLRDTLRQLEPVHVDLVLDGEPMSGDYLLLEVMNFGGAGPNLSLVPQGASADGLLDVVAVSGDHRAQLIENLPRYRFGRDSAPPLPVRRARHVSLRCKCCRMHLDDQLRVGQSGIDVMVEHHAVTFLV